MLKVKIRYLFSTGCLTLLFAPCLFAQINGTKSTQELIERVLPGSSSNFLLENIPSEKGKDVYEILSCEKKIVLRGNSPLSLAMAFNIYLREVALTNYDWQTTKPLYLNKLPLPKNKIHRICSAQERFFNNTCTFGYTFPYWGWEKWERFIDWMAMNGINRPLMQGGQEAVWLKVWESLGMSQEQVCAYFSAPAHLPWHRMSNMDRWGGPLPLSYINGQKELQKKLLKRCRELEMKPILSAFAGHVPAELKKLFPNTKISTIKPGWGGMDSVYTTCFLDPTEPLFTEIQHRFLTIQQEIYGTDHLYSADPFNEITPPSWEPDFLASVSKTIYESMSKTDANTVWYQMSWTFYYDTEHWTQPRLAAMVNAVPKGKLVFLDYVCEEEEYFRKSQNFQGAPFIWCYLGNFGGNTHLVAPVNKVMNRLKSISENNTCIGVGSTLEGINVNSMIYEMVLETPWLGQNIKIDNFIQKYADRRSGNKNKHVQGAWKMLVDKVLIDSAVAIWNHSIIFQVSPVTNLKNRFWSTNPDVPYDNKDLLKVIQMLTKAGQSTKKTDAYQFDIVNFTRQMLGNYGLTLYAKMMEAYQKKDLNGFKTTSMNFLTLGYEIDTLLGTRHEFLLGNWLADAINTGQSTAEKMYYERDAREIITTWHKAGGGLTDYSNRQWNGLMRSYYLPRWNEFILRLESSIKTGNEFDPKNFAQWCTQFEQNWVDNTNETFAEKPVRNAVLTSIKLIKKYQKEISSNP
jgi:alpha-N-acetylglucosaminidase